MAVSGRLGRFVLLVSSLGVTGCVVKTGGPAGSPTPPPPPASAPVAPAAPAAAQPAAPEEACPQELGADAPDTPDGAPQLGEGSHRGCYGLDDRRDVFALTAPAHAGPVLYRLRLTSPDGQPCLEAKDADRAVLPRLNTCSSGKGAALDAWAVVMGGTSWLLETRDGRGDWHKHARPYTLDIQATPLADLGEPDAKERPVPLALGEAKQAFLINAGNAKDLHHDYFSVVVPKDMRKKTRFQVEIADVAADAQVALEVFDSDGRKLGGGSGANPGATLRTEVKMKGPGTYVFHLRNTMGNNGIVAGKDEPAVRMTKPYTIKVSVD